ncbi:dTDP-4-dehydrorhamnose reductase [Pedobacter sp. SYP-B3415]|uniref:dTDP-4-dehydrorhamnose reductase n=1 Tax=Pedobacter sp. SYP-B3415 TaxID=2496641 RepID=UPI00101B88B2|nr:dTDP-4-dehydrorhamnose reductase [Pedobacter sp. SYP-B3415]
MKVLLTGASGILGTDIKLQLESRGDEVLGFNSSDIAITDFESVSGIVKNFRPDVVIHSAAMTAVDRCEDEQELAYAVNVTGTKNMAMTAAQAGARLVYISSCGVYGNGKSTPYHEMDATQPVNYHHQTKLEGERQVKTHHSDYLIVRPGWLFGGTPGHKKNFVAARRKEAITNPVLQSAFDKIGSPTFTKDVAAQLVVLLDHGYTGLFNLVNEGEASRFSYVSEIVRLFELDTRIEAVNSSMFPRRANMPDNECLENRNLNLKGCNTMRHWKLALKEYINTNYQSYE